nr:ribonuclease 3-like protein 1 [Tanacetum cinerariifolium]GEY82462.1 ribonuclease 3-like protein 1 [Tanacetum cinerariifolium]
MAPLTSPITRADNGYQNTPSDPVKLTARSGLYEMCAKSHWKLPVFVCCNEQGPSNRRLYTYKVIVDMKEDGSSIVVECMGKPQLNKKNAAESAAEGALWYLVHLGYPKAADKSKKKR